jgi:hypothetical protein
MQPKSQHRVWMMMTGPALALIGYLAMPPALIGQAAAL